jgi:hypothetical protein
MSRRLLALAGLAIGLATMPSSVAIAQSPAEMRAAAPPRILLDPPLAEPLSRGVVFIHYRTEKLLVVPVFGPKAAELSPPIGHLHVALDGSSWGWGNTSGEPLILFGLPPGPHKLEITLVNANHQPLHRSVMEFVMPAREAATKRH